MKRLIGRRNCPFCNEIYNIYYKPPKKANVCDFHPDTQLTHRADDNEESVATRLATYDELTEPLLSYYEKTGRLKKISGEGSLEEIYSQLEKMI